MRNNNTLSCNYHANQSINNNFQQMLDTFQELMKYGQIDHHWHHTFSLYSDHSFNQISNSNIKQIKQIIAKLLAHGILNNNQSNLIFEFHSYKEHPFQAMNEVYKLLLNAIFKSNIHNLKCRKKNILVLCFTDALNKCNANILDILMTHFTLSNHELYKIIIKLNFNENNLALQHCINVIFDEINFLSFPQWQINDLFDWVVNNKLSIILSYLFDKPLFWQQLIITEDTLMRLSIMYAIFKDEFYLSIIDYLKNHLNILNTKFVKNIVEKLNDNLTALVNANTAYSCMTDFLEAYKYSLITTEQQRNIIYNQQHQIVDLKATIRTLEEKISLLTKTPQITTINNDQLSKENLELHNALFHGFKLPSDSLVTQPSVPPPPYSTPPDHMVLGKTVPEIRFTIDHPFIYIEKGLNAVLPHPGLPKSKHSKNKLIIS
jgi:hypothetical protein